jgi:hypothetical protein
MTNDPDDVTAAPEVLTVNEVLDRVWERHVERVEWERRCTDLHLQGLLELAPRLKFGP